MPKQKYHFFNFKPVVLLSKYERWRRIAKSLKLSKKARQRLEWIIYYYAKSQKNVSLTSRHFDITRRMFYYWYNRFDEANLRTLEDRNTAPINKRQREITSEQEQRIIALRKEHIHWGKIKLAIIYYKAYQEKISSWKIQKVIELYKLYPNRKRAEKLRVKRLKVQKRKRITELKKKPIMGYLIHFDTIVIYWNGLKRYVFTMIDEYTKIAFARMYATKSSYNARDFFRRVNFLLDYQCVNCHQDNGSEFMKYFEEALKKENIKQYWSRPRTPKDNPSLERFNQTIQREWINNAHFTPEVDRFNQELSPWIIEYNFERPHQSLDYLTPIEFAIKYKQLSQMYSSRTRACRTDEDVVQLVIAQFW